MVEIEGPEEREAMRPMKLRRPLFYVKEEVSHDASSTRYWKHFPSTFTVLSVISLRGRAGTRIEEKFR